MTDKTSSTTAQLRGDIDSGTTGAKVSAPDPAASPLGTDDEAAGNTPSEDRIEMAREAEKKIGEAAKRRGGRA